MEFRNVFQVDVLRETLTPGIADAGEQDGERTFFLEEWFEDFFDGERDVFPGADGDGVFSLESLREMLRGRQARVFRFRRGKDSLRWYELRLLPDWGQDLSLLMVREIHQEFSKTRKEARLSLYRSVRRELALYRERELNCGIVIRETDGDKICFADSKSVSFIKSELFKERREELRQKADNLLKALDGQETEGMSKSSDCFIFDLGDGKERWVHLFSRSMVMESGRQYQYLYYFCMPLEAGAARPNMFEPEKGRLTELVESYLFEWNVEDNHLTLTDNWDTKFQAVGDVKHGFRKIESYIFKDDISKVRKMFNAILTGDIEDNIIVRFYVKDGREREQADLCSISLISVLYDGKMPVYVVGSVRDLSSKLKTVMETTLKAHGVSRKMTGRAKLLVEHMIQKAPYGSRHALIAIKMRALNDSDNTGMELLIYQYMELVTRMIYPDDIVWVDDCNLMLFLHNVGNDLNAREKAEYICRILEDRENGELMADVGVAICPENGDNFDTLMAQVKIDLRNNSQTLDGREKDSRVPDRINAYSSVNIISDILDEWYRTVKTNNALKEKMELTKAQLMLSQIKPHFIYNVLANIKSLIYIDADKASDIVVAFTKYLRVQLNALDKEEMAPFTEILDFVRNYIEIEKSRFPGKITETYDIGYENFRMPHFILQPVVENAIKHGICKRDEPGTLSIKSFLREQTIVIEVEDDGVGFEVGKKIAPGRDHGVGLENVRIRLQHLVKGTIKMESRVGYGTKVIIEMPKQ